MFHSQNLKPYNTFGMDVEAKNFLVLKNDNDFEKVLKHCAENNIKPQILGGGSNVLLTGDIKEHLILIDTKGISIVNENDTHVNVVVNAGEVWHNFVRWCVHKNYGGLENLSLIPGKVGACPIQNIGAYGVEVKDRIVEVETINVETAERRIWQNEECDFGYRNSVFKQAEKGKWIITSVNFKLTKDNHELVTHYGSIEQELFEMGKSKDNVTIEDISDAVIKIRQSKLPDPAEIGNSGSFFKNPVVDSIIADKVKSEHPDAPIYPAGENKKKLAAGWLIEKAGWKGFTDGEFGVHKKQALVLVNYGEAKGKDIYNLSQKILDDVHAKFGIHLEREVNIW